MSPTTSEFISHLRARGLIAQISHEDELTQILSKSHLNKKGRPHAVYCGVDPTAESLHVGNLVPLMMLRRAQDAGLTPIVLFGGATGLIGDPTGRTEMRPMSTKEDIARYIENFKKLAIRYFRTDVPNPPVFVNNIDWIGPMSWIDFARDVGSHFTVARLLSAEVNKTRFKEGGLTFMELGYQLLQSYDFLHLYQHHDCIMQFGGDDQWSNVLGGADLIRRVLQGKAFAVTTPLLIDSDGRKFGKTAGNAIWLDARLTSPYEFYQFFRNVNDPDVKKMFYVFTLKSKEEIDALIQEKHINEAKDALAFEITKISHGEEAAQKAQQTAKSLFVGGELDLTSVPKTSVSTLELTAGLDILALLIKCGLSPSRGEARKLIQGGGLTLNGEKWTDIAHQVKDSDFQAKQGGLLLRKGKKDYHLVTLV